MREFDFYGRRYQVESQLWVGEQDSPFDDGIISRRDITVRNLKNHATLNFSEMLPPYIERYGFYEGMENPYRVAPQKIVEVFDFLRKNK